MTNTSSYRTRALLWTVVLTLLVLAGQAMEYGSATPAGPEVAVSVVPALPAPAPSADVDGEVWWTTTQGCVGEVPCYDPQAFTDPEALPPVSMWVVQDGEVSEAMFAALVHLGYRYPVDGPEVLYVPLSVMQEECRTDSDCAAVEESVRQAGQFPYI